MSRGARRIERRESAPIPATLADLHPILARVYAARGVSSADEVIYRLDHLPPYDALQDIDAATALLETALRTGRRILVVGDFDADGATSTALAVKALRAMGAASVDFLVPNRFEYGYGLTPEIVAVAAEREPDLIVTVDNGIASIDGVAAASAAGVDVLVTDHHLPGDRLPAAAAIVNPNRADDGFPCKHLAGVGVVFYVLLALRARLRDSGWFDERGCEPPNLARYLDLVALGTVADMVPLDRVNRALVAQGLARIRAGHGCAGIEALLRVAGRDRDRLVATDLGFAVGPRINAAGRLDDMSIGIRCLLSEDGGEAMAIAAELDRLNRERRTLEHQMEAEAREHLDSLTIEADGMLPTSICLYRPDWHPGVVGLLASRIKERLHRPVVVFADEGQESIKGSARSIRDLHIRDALDAIATRHPGLLSRFGGHAMAAGLTLPRDRFAAFREAFEEEACRQLSAADLEGRLLSDGALEGGEAGLELAAVLRNAGPWGQGFPEPLFDGEFEVVRHRILKERHLKLQLRWPACGTEVDAIAFNAELTGWTGNARRLHVAYRLDINEFRGNVSTQLIVEHFTVLG